jgi:hypothetical protein
MCKKGTPNQLSAADCSFHLIIVIFFVIFIVIILTCIVSKRFFVYTVTFGPNRRWHLGEPAKEVAVGSAFFRVRTIAPSMLFIRFFGVTSLLP